MKTFLQILTAGLLLVATTLPLQALFMILDRPGLAYPEGFSEEGRKEIQATLEHPECHFYGGSALNWHTTLRYGGSTPSLNSFLQGLAACEGVRIKVSFVESLPEEGDWHVLHSAHDNGGLGFHIRISLESKSLELTELPIPNILGSSHAGPADTEPSTPESKSEDQEKPESEDHSP